MMSLKRWHVFGILMILVLILAACGGGGAAEEAPAAEEPAAAEEAAPEEEMAEMEAPTELSMAAILTAGLENSWDAAFIDAYKRVQVESPHGLKLTKYSVIRKFGMHAATCKVAAKPVAVLLKLCGETMI